MKKEIPVGFFGVSFNDLNKEQLKEMVIYLYNENLRIKKELDSYEKNIFNVPLKN